MCVIFEDYVSGAFSLHWSWFDGSKNVIWYLSRL